MAVWQEKRLGDIINIKHGFAFKGEYISDEANGIVLVTPGNFHIGGGFKKTDKKFYYGEIPQDFILKPKDLIITMTDLSKDADTIGYSALIPNDNNIYLHNQRIGLVSVLCSNIDKQFIYWLLRTSSYQRQIANTSNGTNVKHTSPNRIYSYKCLIPDLATQEKIADILSAYDDLIENNNRRIEILEQMAQEIYKEWFVRFRFPGHEKVKFINGLPEGWDVVRLGDFANIKGGKRLPIGKDFCIEQTEHPYIRIRDISKYKFILLTENMMYIDNATFNILKRFTVKTGDLLISIVGTIGLVSCVGSTLNGANLTENCVNVTEVRHFTKSYLYHYLKSSQGQGELYSGIVGVSQPKLPLYNIKKFKLLKPPQELIIKFTNLVANIDSKMNNLLEKNQNLIKQRDLLLPRLMSGKLEV